MGRLERVTAGATALAALGAMVGSFTQPDSDLAWVAGWCVAVGIIVALAGLLGLAIRSDRPWVRRTSRWLLGGAALIVLLVFVGLLLQGYAMYEASQPMSPEQEQALDARYEAHTVTSPDAWPEEVVYASNRLRTDIRAALELIGVDPSDIEPDLASLEYPIEPFVVGVVGEMDSGLTCEDGEFYDYNSEVDFWNFDSAPMVRDFDEVQFETDQAGVDRIGAYWSEAGYEVKPSAAWVFSVESDFGLIILDDPRNADDEYKIVFWSMCGPLAGTTTQ